MKLVRCARYCTALDDHFNFRFIGVIRPDEHQDDKPAHTLRLEKDFQVAGGFGSDNESFLAQIERVDFRRPVQAQNRQRRETDILHLDGMAVYRAWFEGCEDYLNRIDHNVALVQVQRSDGRGFAEVPAML